MVWEFPAVSQSRYEFWNKQQYTRKGMWWFTLVGGFFGLHHILLRSPQTGLACMFANILTLGYFYFYDLIQLSESGGLGDEGLNIYGLGSAAGPLGIAKGMWIPEAASTKQQGGASIGVSDDGPPSPWFFLVYALTIPLPYLATAVAGDYQNALTRFLFLIVVPFGFILGFCAMIYDYWILLSQPADLLKFGTKRFFPFPLLGWDKDGHSPYITSTHEGSQCPPDNSFIGTFKSLILLSASIIRVVSPATADSIIAGVKIATDAAHTAKVVVVNTGSAVSRVGSQVADVAIKGPAAASSALAHASAVAANPLAMIGKLEEPPAPSAPPAPPAPSAPPAPPAPSAPAAPPAPSAPAAHSVAAQTGGSLLEKTPMDYLAFSAIAALIASGLVITFNRNSQNDSPPDS